MTLCFTDASYSPQHHIACLGYMVGTDENIHTEIITTDGVAEAEKLATERCLYYCRQSGIQGRIIIYTDHQGSLKKEEHWKQQFGDIELRLIQGHKKTSEKSEIDLIFTKVDRLTRKLLRQHVNTMNS
jgi:hypothetical protein